jgi:hypothetical protein
MIRYKCSVCKGNQYTATTNRTNDKCIYCGHAGVEQKNNLEEKEEAEEKKNESCGL